jgi:hypothetical protein
METLWSGETGAQLAILGNAINLSKQLEQKKKNQKEIVFSEFFKLRNKL